MPFYRRSTQPPPLAQPPEWKFPTFLIICIILTLIALRILFSFAMNFYDYASEPAPGILVSESPEQQPTDVQPFEVKGLTIEPLAELTIRGRVLSIKATSYSELS